MKGLRNNASSLKRKFSLGCLTAMATEIFYSTNRTNVDSAFSVIRKAYVQGQVTEIRFHAEFEKYQNLKKAGC
ncbi:hypothetical protein [Flavihumibacter profundi]|uniref:hypothetical protein n=1 Tax=Flavihumibacter profundi TaxID=2716883 RepID=UPI001CC5833F|nr:hypothetical protein [Flavihumibacter profundi]MBZ5859441.1 hypothetical protein [Flavihumibacter profundi]